MKKLTKVFAWGFGIFLTLVIITGIAVKVIVTKDFIATKIENAINGRVEIRDISVPLWAAFSGISIDGFKIAEKDAEMNKPMKDRAPIAKEVIGFDRFEFKVAVGKLIMSLGKQFELKSLLLVKPKANVVLYEKGGNNIIPLLVKVSDKSPEKNQDTADSKVAKKEGAAAAAGKTKDKKQAAKADGETDNNAEKPFSIKSAPGVIKMGKIGMEGGEFTVNVQKIQNTLIVNNVNFLLKDVYIDPQNLDKPEKNRVKMSSSFSMELKENKKAGAAVSSFLFLFSSNGTIQPFDAKTGTVAKIMTVEAVFHKGTKMTGLAVFEKFKNNTEQLKKIGVNLGFLKDDIVLTDDSKVKLEYNYGKITFLNDLVINSADSSIVVSEKSWIDTNNYENLLNGYFKLAPNHSAEVEKQVDSAIKPAIDAAVNNLPAGLKSTASESLKVDVIRNNILKPARDDQNRIMLGYRSTGRLSHPTVVITKPEFPTAREVVAQQSGKIKADAGAVVKEQVTKAVNEATKKETTKAANTGAEKAKQEAVTKLKKMF